MVRKHAGRGGHRKVKHRPSLSLACLPRASLDRPSQRSHHRRPRLESSVVPKPSPPRAPSSRPPAPSSLCLSSPDPPCLPCSPQSPHCASLHHRSRGSSSGGRGSPRRELPLNEQRGSSLIRWRAVPLLQTVRGGGDKRRGRGWLAAEPITGVKGMVQRQEEGGTRGGEGCQPEEAGEAYVRSVASDNHQLSKTWRHRQASGGEPEARG